MSKETAFAVFCLESYKLYRNLTGKEAVEIFENYGVFQYVTEFYDVLHTAGESYINNDIDIFLEKRGYLFQN